MYFYRQLASHLSLTSWRNSLFSSPLLFLRSTDSTPCLISSKFLEQYSLFKIYSQFFPFLLFSKYLEIMRILSLLREILRSTEKPTMRRRIGNGWSVKRYIRSRYYIGHGTKNRLAEKRGGRDTARAKQIVANKKLIHGGELEGANT